VKVHALGRGSNLVVPDEGVDGLVISLAHSVWQSCNSVPTAACGRAPDCG